MPNFEPTPEDVRALEALAQASPGEVVEHISTIQHPTDTFIGFAIDRRTYWHQMPRFMSGMEAHRQEARDVARAKLGISP